MKVALISLLVATAKSVTPSPTVWECVSGWKESRECERTFYAALGAKNGVAAQAYIFRKVKLSPPADRMLSYSPAMRLECDSRGGMKAICDKKSFCKWTEDIINLGQTAHIAHLPHRNNDALFPSGWSAIKREWDGLCSYTGLPTGNAMCDNGIKHIWQKPYESNPGFICAKKTSCLDYFTVALESMNGVPTQRYEFCKMMPNDTENNYSANMIEQCGSEGFKPVCDHQTYCQNDANSLYIGQAGHLAHSGNRNDENKVPVGFASVANKWISVCSYTASQHGNSALCNVDSISHFWKPPSQLKAEFICGRVFEAGTTEAPTFSPTPVGYRHPTASPTDSSSAPTRSPTLSPLVTDGPTTSPTSFPSAGPTAGPSVSPKEAAEATCNAADKKSCRTALTKAQGKCKFKKKTGCQLKVFNAVDCTTLVKRECKKAVKAGVCGKWNKKTKSCVNL